MPHQRSSLLSPAALQILDRFKPQSIRPQSQVLSDDVYQRILASLPPLEQEAPEPPPDIEQLVGSALDQPVTGLEGATDVTNMVNQALGVSGTTTSLPRSPLQAVSDLELGTREAQPVGGFDRDLGVRLIGNVIHNARDIVGGGVELGKEGVKALSKLAQFLNAGDPGAQAQAVAGAAPGLINFAGESIKNTAQRMAQDALEGVREERVNEDLAGVRRDALDIEGLDFDSTFQEFKERELAGRRALAQERGPRISATDRPADSRVQSVQSAMESVGGALVDIGSDPAKIGEWMFQHPVDVAFIADLTRQAPRLLRAVIGKELTEEAVRSAARATGVDQNVARDALGRVRTLQLGPAPAAVVDAERGVIPLSRRLAPAPAEAELRAAGTAGPLRSVPVDTPPGELPLVADDAVEGIHTKIMRDLQRGVATDEAAAVEAETFFGDIAEGVARPDPVGAAKFRLDRNTITRLARGLDAEDIRATPLDRSRGLAEGSKLSPAGVTEVKAQAARTMLRGGTRRDVVEETLTIIEEMEGASEVAAAASDVSIERTIFDRVSGVSPEFLERGGMELKDAPRRIKLRTRKAGRAGVDELEGVAGTGEESLTEADIVRVLSGPAPRDLRIERVAEVLEELGLAKSGEDAIEMAALFDPTQRGVVLRRLLRGPGTDKNPNRAYRNMVGFVETRLGVDRMAEQAARAVREAGRVQMTRASLDPKTYLMQYARAAGARSIDDVPAFIRGAEAEDTLMAVETILGNIESPIEATMRVTRPASWWRNSLRDRVGSMGLPDETLGQIAFAFTGKTAMPSDVGVLKLMAKHLDDMRNGRMPIAMDAATVRQVRGRGKPIPKAKPTEIIPKDALPKDFANALDESLGPNAGLVTDARDITAIEMLLRDVDKSIPEIGEIARPAFEAYHRKVAEFVERLDGVFQGLRVDSEEAALVTKILTGQFGDEAAIFADSSLVARAAGIQANTAELVAGIARQVRAVEDDIFELLTKGVDGTGGVMPNLNRRPHHLSFLREQYWDQNRMPADLVRFTDREFWFRFAKRTSEEIPDNINVMESLRAYIPGALRQVYLNPIFPKLDRLRESFQFSQLGNKAELLDIFEDMVKGRRIRYEAALNRDVTRLHRSVAQSKAGQFMGMDANTLPGDAERLSMFIAQNFYRGVLGGNVSAALNNATQTINTMADTGVLRTLQGMAKMMTPQGRSLAKAAELDKQFARLFETNYKWGSTTKTMDDILFAPFNAVEFFNRGVAFHAGSSKALAEGMSARAAALEGLLTSGRTQFYYDEVARAPFFRTSVGRSMGVLTSFPIKQAEFMGDLIRNERTLLPGVSFRGAGMVRYIMVSGLASVVAEELVGVRLSALRRVDLPGTDLNIVPGMEFAQSLEGLPFGVSPVGQTGVALMDFLSATDEDPVTQWDLFGDFLDVATNALPAAVQTKEILNGLTAGSRGERRQSITHMPFFKELMQDKPTGKILDTTYRQELQRVVGMTDIDQARERDTVRDAAGEGSEGKALRQRTADLAVARMKRGDLEGAADLLAGAGVSMSALQTRLGQFDQSQLMRVLLNSFGEQDRLDFVRRHPEVLDMLAGEGGQ